MIDAKKYFISLFLFSFIPCSAMEDPQAQEAPLKTISLCYDADGGLIELKRHQEDEAANDSYQLWRGDKLLADATPSPSADVKRWGHKIYSLDDGKIVWRYTKPEASLDKIAIYDNQGQLSVAINNAHTACSYNGKVYGINNYDGAIIASERFDGQTITCQKKSSLIRMEACGYSCWNGKMPFLEAVSRRNNLHLVDLETQKYEYREGYTRLDTPRIQATSEGLLFKSCMGQEAEAVIIQDLRSKSKVGSLKNVLNWDNQRRVHVPRKGNYFVMSHWIHDKGGNKGVSKPTYLAMRLWDMRKMPGDVYKEEPIIEYSLSGYKDSDLSHDGSKFAYIDNNDLVKTLDFNSAIAHDREYGTSIRASRNREEFRRLLKAVCEIGK